MLAHQIVNRQSTIVNIKDCLGEICFCFLKFLYAVFKVLQPNDLSVLQLCYQWLMGTLRAGGLPSITTVWRFFKIPCDGLPFGAKRNLSEFLTRRQGF